jgi:predicted MPP superfamily phosphohydrolase
MRRRGFLAIALGLPTAGAVYARFVEPQWLKFHQSECKLFSNPRPEPVCLLHLSDLHASSVVPNSLIERAIDLGLAAKPDLICLTGDYVTHGHDFDARWLERQFAKLSSAAPTFASLGNHDGGVWAKSRGGFGNSTDVAGILNAGRVRVLHNENCRVQARGRNLQLVGLGDLWAGEFDPTSAFAAGQGGSEAVIVLSHNPDTKERVKAYRWNLMLSGHTHGGQVSLPYFGAPYAPVVDRRYLAGLKPWNDRLIHVTTGVGNLHGVRFNCRPEVSYLLLH